MSIAVIFPGQGSQVVGMGVRLAKEFKVAKILFDEIDDALNEKLSDIMKNGDEIKLQLTKNAQPALMATGIAVVKVIEKLSGKSITNIASHTAGHSLGEYTALVASQSLKVSDAARLLRLRGLSMQSAVPVGMGGMVALIGVSIEDVEHFIASVSNIKGVVEVANDNAPGQVVISGDTKPVEAVLDFAKKNGVKRAIKLSVSAPFHSSLMQPAAKKMKLALDSIDLLEPKIPVISNVTAVPETAPNLLKNNLVSQITGKVRWRETMEVLPLLGVSQIIEMGTGKVLTGLARRGAKDLTSFSIETPEEIINWIEKSNIIN